MQPDVETFRIGMRRLASAVSVVTTAAQGERHGMTASAVCSVSAQPPQLLVCINRNARTHDLIERAKCFAVNVLGAEQVELARRFSLPSMPPADRFDHGSWGELITGSPVLRDCVVAFDCRVDTAVESGTHTIFIGRVLAVSEHPGTGLLYADRQFGSFAQAC